MLPSRTLLTVTLALACLLPAADLLARAPDRYGERPTATTVRAGNPLGHRSNCRNSDATRFQNTNNVRAILSTGGDVWWNGSEGRYIVPNVAAGEEQVSSIFAGAVWLGGRDPGGNIKLAAQQFGRSVGDYDFYPGPLDVDGTTTQEQCTRWDRIFAVTSAEILEHQRLFELSLAGEIEYTEDLIPEGVRGWPSRGNPYFENVWGYPLPDNGEPLAGFFDYFDEEGNGPGNDGIYDPLVGDFPTVEINGCTDYYNDDPEQRDLPQFPDEMFFWIYNDAGNVHRESEADPLNMEVQVQSFAYNTNDALNDMTFQRYRLINRGLEELRDTYFAMWVDIDLGCSDDDYVGCDTVRSLAFAYNVDPVDGVTGTVCTQGGPTYGTEVPAVGIDYFRGPNEFVLVPDPEGEPGDSIIGARELGMSSFTYVQRSTATAPVPAGMQDPTPGRPLEFYRLLSGFWRDGTPYTASGTGYNTPGPTVRYAFPSNPSLPAGPGVWSAASDNVGEGDRRTIQASGPFTLVSGAINELIIGVPWVPDIRDLPGPSLARLLAADDLAQNLFDNCFDITDGPDAPDVDIIELDQELVLVLTADDVNSNNAFLGYEEVDLQAPDGVVDSVYRFEGFKVFQITSPEVTDFGDPTQARLVFQSDVQNGVGEIYNWERIENPFDANAPVFEPVAQVEAGSTDNGIRTVFRVTTDLFAEGDTRLINHKPYYYKAITYAYNNYETFDPLEPGGRGQATPYLAGRRNIRTATGVPRPITDTRLVAAGAQGMVTRLDGEGTGGDNFLDLADGERERLRDTREPSPLTYRDGRGPIDAQVFNPFAARDGRYRVIFADDTPEDDVFDEDATWRLLQVSDAGEEVLTADQELSAVTEYVIGEIGVAISLGQVAEPGERPRSGNGCIGYEVEGGNGPDRWYQMIPNKSPLLDSLPVGDQIFNFAQTSVADEGLGSDYALEDDLEQSLTECFGGEWLPLKLTAGVNERADGAGLSFVSPMIRTGTRPAANTLELSDLNNVDIVFTPDKSLWSRCVVLETGFPAFAAGAPTAGSARLWTPRRDSSVTRDAGPDGNPLPDDSGTTGFGWFPGYAIDVETGQRLNVFFGENSGVRPENEVYNETATLQGEPIAALTGGDMAFNPTSDLVAAIPGGAGLNPFNVIAGGQHFVYVTREPYDSCVAIHAQLTSGNGNGARQATLAAITKITYAGLMLPRRPLLSYAEGLIPSEVVVKLRVTNPFQVALTQERADEDRDAFYRAPTGINGGYPAYEFTLEGVEPQSLLTTAQDSILSFVNVVPNPYYGYSDYEISEFSNIIRITNLPAFATITIYSLDGKFIRRYTRAEEPQPPFNEGPISNLNNRGIVSRQIYPDLDWDMRNAEGIPVASGTYLIHVDAGELGQRTLKSFIIQRAFDPAGL